MGPGEVGYLITGVKEIDRIKVGDTITSTRRPAETPLPGYSEPKPMVFSGLFPTDGDDFEKLREALEKLRLNDASLAWEPETSKALGFGFRCGFLGLLHMEIVRERLEREYDLDLVATAPSVAYRVRLTDGSEREIKSPQDLPEPTERTAIFEPYVKAMILTPTDYVGPIMELATARRAVVGNMTYLSPERVELDFDIPLGEIVFDFFDVLKSKTKGYASLDYEPSGYKEGDLVKVDILLNAQPVDAFSAIVHRDHAQEYGKKMTSRLAHAHSETALRRAHPGSDRWPGHQPGNRQGHSQGRDRQVLRRRHQPQEEAPQSAEGGQEAHEDGGLGGGASGGVRGCPQGRRRVMTPAAADAFATAAAAYVHIPFCARVCPYCDFAVVAGRDDLAERYVSALIAEIDSSPPWRSLDAVFFGGGTPSHLDPRLLGSILDALSDHHGFAADVELTLEANPEDFDSSRAAELVGAGFNRVSFGAQSFDDEVLVSLGRRHEASAIARSVTTARSAGFRSVSVDLIYGTPGESDDSWAESVGRRGRAPDRSSVCVCPHRRAGHAAGPSGRHRCARPRSRCPGRSLRDGRPGGFRRRAGSLRGVQLGTPRARVPLQPHGVGPGGVRGIRERGSRVSAGTPLSQSPKARRLHGADRVGSISWGRRRPDRGLGCRARSSLRGSPPSGRGGIRSRHGGIADQRRGPVVASRRRDRVHRRPALGEPTAAHRCGPSFRSRAGGPYRHCG